ncbi:MAG: hypothetical protein IPJ61_21145 [Tessaracoccus sp.]|uniref:hypothetical protein n=1 Tax=Tessaracoccus sp. TaxID=1971211 RepID=UPI001EB9EE97|nr:hypothetical protein [Tessaracoccus sp.]MBK7823495.1 hypothetical protein [Tessaracoccus sp.]
MTQSEIAKLCRTQQSVVNGWLHGKGKALAYEDQVVELRRRYSSRLNRTTSRVYLVEPLAAPPEASAAPLACRIIAVEGPIVFRYTFTRPYADRQPKVPGTYRREPIGRWLVHRQARDQFVLVQLTRRHLDGELRERWRETLWAGGVQGEQPRTVWVDCDDDAGRWSAAINAPVDASGLLALCDRHLADSNALHGPHDELTLPFLVRRMLVEHGHDVPGLERMPAVE